MKEENNKPTHGFDKLRAVRVEKLNKLIEEGAVPYPYRFDVSHKIDAVKAKEPELTASETDISLAGRVMSLRGHGKTVFGHLEDAAGRLQFYVRKDVLGDDSFKIFKLVEVGDFIGIRGKLFRTKTDELTLKAESFEVLSKALRPLPEKWHGLTDKEIRYRQRYVDLVMNREVREVFYTRSRLVEIIRQFLIQRGYVEVETPILQPLYGGAAARPFITHHNMLDMPLYMRIADELYLKRLLVGGFERVFEFSKDFRNEGLDRSHNPEFTMLECYAAFLDYGDYMDMVEEMMRTVAGELTENGVVTYGDHQLDFNQPWARVRFYDAIRDKTGVDFRGLDEAAVRAEAKKLGMDVDDDTPLSKVLDEVFGEKVEPDLIQPTFVYDYPKELSPLAKDHRSEEGLVERFEPFMCGFEVGNAFSELNDPIEQRKRFEQQAAFRAKGDDEAHVLDEDYIRAMEYGMPPAAGLGLGIDRLTMIFTDSHSIRDVIFFPHMRPEEGRG